jgi:hypothetical protein
MAVEFTKVQDWGIVPPQNEICFDNKCFNVINPRLISIFPDRINHISLGFRMSVPPGYIIQIKHHLSGKPWKVINEYMTAETLYTPVQLSIITPYELQLQPGEILTHIQLQRITGVLATIEGT